MISVDRLLQPMGLCEECKTNKSTFEIRFEQVDIDIYICQECMDGLQKEMDLL